jgi:chromosome segregation ATPase
VKEAVQTITIRFVQNGSWSFYGKLVSYNLNMNVNTLTIEQLNRELISRHSRASGTIEARRERLKRFLEFENQKERRQRAVQQVRADKEAEAEMDGQQDEVDTEEEQAVRTLLRLREDIERSEYYINHLIPRMKAVEEAFIDLDESYEVVVGENLRLNQRINNLEMRLSHVENRSDSPPPLILPESNPNWRLDTAFTTYTSSPAP